MRLAGQFRSRLFPDPGVQEPNRPIKSMPAVTHIFSVASPSTNAKLVDSWLRYHKVPLALDPHPNSRTFFSRGNPHEGYCIQFWLGPTVTHPAPKPRFRKLVIT